MIGRNKGFKYKRASFVALVASCVIIFNLINVNLLNNVNNNISNNQNHELKPYTSGLESYTLEWLDNGAFDSPVTEWFNETEGDLTDTNATLSNGFANLELLGDSGSFSTTALEPTPNSSSEWRYFENPEFPSFPVDSLEVEQFGIDNNGWWASHHWEENFDVERSRPSIHWKKNYTLPVTMADYSILSASVYATINGSCEAIGAAQGGIDVHGDEISSTLKSILTGDFARFYILISDPEGIEEYEIAFNQTTTLGLDAHEPAYGDGNDYLDNALMTSVPENILIAFLESIFLRTGDTFTITLGININCEDNKATDEDEWIELRIKEFGLNFTYAKKMNRYAAVSWSQTGNQVPTGANIQVDYATLEFDVKSNKNFTADSPNSEVRALINGNKFVDTIKLDELNDTFDHIVLDLSPLIQKGINITTSIQVMLLDNFILNETFIISIDNVSLEIKYSIISGLEDTDYDLYLKGENKTLPKSIEIAIGELVNISFNYRDSSDVFIENATVELTGYGSKKTLANTSALEIYNITIDTAYMSLGENYLTLTASKVGYVDQEIVITIDVVKRTALMDIFLNKVNKTDDRSIYITSGYPLNITVMLEDSITGDFVGNMSVKVINGDPDHSWTKSLTENSSYEYYSIIINSSLDMDPGITFLALLVEHDNYTSLTADLTISTSSRATYYKLYVNGYDKTNEPSYKITVGYELNVTLQYFDDEYDTHVPNATVRLLGGGVNITLEQNITHGYYFRIINASEFNAAVNFITVYAQKSGYQSLNPLLTLEIVDVKTNMQVLLNGKDITNDSYYQIPYGGYLNFSITYFNTSHINGAEVNLRHGGNLLGSLNETGGRYNISINIVDDANLDLGLSILTIEALKSNYQTQTANIRIDIRQIKCEIYPEGGQPAIAASYLETVMIRIQLKDIDFGKNISGATVIFTSNIPRDDLRGGTFTGLGNGWYEVVLTAVPAGTYIITITVLGGGVYDNYDFERFDLTLSVSIPPENLFWFQLITGLAIGAMVGFGGYLIAYQKVLKYPKPVRKVHKVKKMFKKNKFKDLDILDRDKTFNALYKAELQGHPDFLPEQPEESATELSPAREKLQGLKKNLKEKSSGLKEKVKEKIDELK